MRPPPAQCPSAGLWPPSYVFGGHQTDACGESLRRGPGLVRNWSSRRCETEVIPASGSSSASASQQLATSRSPEPSVASATTLHRGILPVARWPCEDARVAAHNYPITVEENPKPQALRRWHTAAAERSWVTQRRRYAACGLSTSQTQDPELPAIHTVSPGAAHPVLDGSNRSQTNTERGRRYWTWICFYRASIARDDRKQRVRTRNDENSKANAGKGFSAFSPVTHNTRISFLNRVPLVRFQPRAPTEMLAYEGFSRFAWVVVGVVRAVPSRVYRARRRSA